MNKSNGETTDDNLIRDYGAVTCFWNLEQKGNKSQLKNTKSTFQTGGYPIGL